MTEPRRCSWARNDLAVAYHDQEWGVPLHDDRLLFEHILLKVTGDDGQLLQRRPNDVNPISYYFSNCQVLD